MSSEMNAAVRSPDTEEIYVDVEEEDEEDEVEEEVEEEDEEDDVSPPPTTTRTTPGKVTPSKKVAELEMRSPLSPTPTPKLGIKPEKNPFPAYGNWTEADVAAITIEFPILSSKNESTNELTRKNRPEARYWKAPISFKYGPFVSTTMRFNNISVPFHTGPSYGSSYLYLSLPKHVENAFAIAGKSRAPTRTIENSLAPDSNRWWKIVNNVEGKVGIVDAGTKKFLPKSLATVFDGTQNGVVLSVILSFKCKASTEETQPIKAGTTRTVSVELVRAFIDNTDVNVEGPTRIAATKKAVAEPAATKSDLASDSLMQRLAQLGL